jgi:hypothetical protein
MPWSQRFADPIPLPDGRELITLRDAGDYVLSLPPAEQVLPCWQNAAETLTLIGDLGGDPMLPRIAMMQALYPLPLRRILPINLRRIAECIAQRFIGLMTNDGDLLGAWHLARLCVHDQNPELNGARPQSALRRA